MAFCKYCGRQLAEGEQCFCKAAPVIPQGNPAPVPAPVPVPMPVPAPVPAPAPKPKRKKTGIIIALVCLLLCIIGGCLLFISLHKVRKEPYEKPVEQIIKGLNQQNYKPIADAYMTDSVRVNFDSVNGDFDAYRLYTDYISEELKEDFKEIAETWDVDADAFRFSYSLISAKKLSRSELEDCYEAEYGRLFYEDNALKEGYKLRFRVTVKAGAESDSASGYLTVVNVKNEGWKFLVGSGKGFEFGNRRLEGLMNAVMNDT
ncbi:MAG: hypothetical protein IJ060_12425 [Oscillospiraceae bacterium]|nr:hypothetical protein [Oscillospiraceae bacterium]MBQ8922938.1 hypothetical protein [Oscillospiraceae bacterium]